MACIPSNMIDCPCDGLENLFVNATYFVDSFYGNDATAVPRDEARPYRTIAAVPVQPGEIVYVQPGTYSIPQLNLNNAIWYFSAGSTITTLVTGVGQIYGYGNFVGQSPAVQFTSNIGQLIMYAQTITTPADAAVVVSGSGKFTLNVRSIAATDGIFINGTVTADITVDEFIGNGDFIIASTLSSGSLICNSQIIQCSQVINSSSNLLKLVLTSQSVNTTGTYAIVISDTNSSQTSSAVYNIHMNRIMCVGLFDISGKQDVTDVLLQPNVNINIQNIVSNSFNTVIRAITSFISMTFDSFSYSSPNPVSHIIDIGESCVIHMNGSKIYNADNSGNSNIGFITITSLQFSSIRCKFIEYFGSGVMINCTGPSEVQMDIVNATIISNNVNYLIESSSQCVINIQRLLTFHAPGIPYLVSNSGLMQFNVGAWQCNCDQTKFVLNFGRLQTRIGFFVSDSSNSVFFENAGDVMGIVCGSIRMNGNNNVGITSVGSTIVDIGQILANNSGNSGIFVQDPGQLYGRISRIITQDQSCIEFTSSRDSNITFDWMTTSANSYVILMTGRGEVTMSGNAITAEEVKYPIYIVAERSKLNLKLLRMDIRNCAAGIYMQATDSDIRIDIQHFVINGDAGIAGIYANSGDLTIEGNYFMETASNVPLFLLEGDVAMKASLSFVNVGYSALTSSTSRGVWYEASDTNSRNAARNVNLNLPNPGQNTTVKGLFRTDGDYNVFVESSAAPFIRALDGVFVSRGRNIGSVTPMDVISNYSIGNTGLDNFTAIPAGGFVTDPAVQ